MEPQDLARWMQTEHKKVEVLMQDLREKIAAVPRTNAGQWLDELRDRFEHARAHFQKHMALEEHEGYLTDVLEQRPTLSDGVDRLKHEHAELTRIMDDIYQTLRRINPTDRLLIQDSCQRIEFFLTCAERHEAEENRLVLSVFTRDIGTRD